jgi:hypothetical protein
MGLRQRNVRSIVIDALFLLEMLAAMAEQTSTRYYGPLHWMYTANEVRSRMMAQSTTAVRKLRCKQRICTSGDLEPHLSFVTYDCGPLLSRRFNRWRSSTLLEATVGASGLLPGN